MSDIVYFKQDGTDVDVTISEVSLTAATLASLETISLSTATLSALETISITGTTTVDGTVALHADSLSALENITVSGTVSLSTASLAALELIGLKGQDGSNVASSGNPLSVVAGPTGDSGGSITHTNVGDSHVALVSPASGQPLDAFKTVEYLGVLVKNGAGEATTLSVFWTDGTSSSAVLARSKITIANGDNAHINFPPGTYGTNNAYLSMTSTSSSGVTAYVHYHQMRS
jgi:hypothetical protein